LFLRSLSVNYSFFLFENLHKGTKKKGKKQKKTGIRGNDFYLKIQNNVVPLYVQIKTNSK